MALGAVLAVVGGVVAIIVALVSLQHDGYIGHSDFFAMLDTSADDAVSYEEWMAYYSLPMHEHPIENCARADFYHADCNQDDALTWREYHDFRFRRQECDSAAVPTLRHLYASSSELGESRKPEYAALVAGRVPRHGLETHRKYRSALTEIYRSALLDREHELKQKYGIR